MAVEAIDVVPAAVEQSTVVGTEGVYSNVSKADTGQMRRPSALMRVHREHRHGAIVVAAAANVAVRQVSRQCLLRVRLRALQELSLARGQEHHLARAAGSDRRSRRTCRASTAACAPVARSISNR